MDLTLLNDYDTDKKLRYNAIKQNFIMGTAIKYVFILSLLN